MMRLPEARLLTMGLLTLLFAAGCGPRESEQVPPSPEGIQQVLEENWAQFERFESDFTVKINSGNYQGYLFGILRLEPPQSLALTLRAMLGIPVGEITISDGKFEASFGDGRFESGTLADLDLQKLAGLPLPAEDVMRIFEPLARPSTDSTETIGFNVEREDSLWQWRTAQGSIERHILFDPVTRSVLEERWVERDGGRVLLIKQYSNFTTAGELRFARDLLLRGGGSYPADLQVRYQDAELNPRWKSDPFLLRSNGA